MLTIGIIAFGLYTGEREYSSWTLCVVTGQPPL